MLPLTLGSTAAPPADTYRADHVLPIAVQFAEGLKRSLLLENLHKTKRARQEARSDQVKRLGAVSRVECAQLVPSRK
jgi:hypothetical protein